MHQAVVLTFLLAGLTSAVSAAQQPSSHSPSANGEARTVAAGAAQPYDPDFVARLAAEARESGAVERGASVFADAKSACLSCHRVGPNGGTVGPDLSKVGKERDLQNLIESVFWPAREVKPEYTAWKIVTAQGKVLDGYKLSSDPGLVLLRDPATEHTERIARADIEDEIPGGTLMPDGLTGPMTRQQQLDLVRFLAELGRSDQAAEAVESAVLHARMHQPATFPYDRAPLKTQDWPHWQDPVNAHRLYDFYTKQAEYFRRQDQLPMLLAEFPGLDGGQFGHWGTQNEQSWADDRWNDTQLGSVQCGIFRGGGVTVPRGVCLRLGERDELSACFNPDTLTYDAVWSGGFVKFSAVRHGFMDGLLIDGKPLVRPEQRPPSDPFVYRGFYRYGKRVVFAYRIAETEYLDAPWAEDGKFTRQVGPAESHPLRQLTTGGPLQWPQVMETTITPGEGRPYAVDTITLPYDNPWKALLFCGGHDFVSRDRALVCTIQGDVWQVDGLAAPTDQPGTVRWRRFAAGLNHALGLVVADDGQIYVQGRDQITRLHDLNGDGEADFYECFSNAYETSTAGHDFICGLERDAEGNFYTASGNQGLVRISPDGRRADVVATGFRNPDGLGLLPDGTVTLPCSEGEWTPASMICAVRQAPSIGEPGNPSPPPHFGYGGPRDGQVPELPLAYLPRGLDNSSGGQVYVSSDRWGPLQGQLLHLSFGMGSHFLVLRDEVGGQLQGAVVPLVGDFLSGVHRGRFNRGDGQLYVSGMHGWVSFTPDDGCFQRVRYTGDPVQLPCGFHLHENGIKVSFTRPIDRAIAERPGNQFAQCWNYRYSASYGSAEFSTTHPGARGHDPLRIASVHVLPDGHTLFLELPDLQPVSQLHLRLHVDSGPGLNLFVTAHRLDHPFESFDGYHPQEKTIAAHPILSDLASNTKIVPNPSIMPINNARLIKMETGKNLTFATRSFKVRAGEPIQFTLSNPDVVPHNWALIRPGTLQKVGGLANRLIADPEAAARQYIPETEDVLVYVDVVPPGDQFTIYFRAPQQPGRYPYLCTFPGHWMVMNGEMIVE